MILYDAQQQSISESAQWLGYSDLLHLYMLVLVMKYLRLWHFWAITKLKYDHIKGVSGKDTNKCSYMMHNINL